MALNKAYNQMTYPDSLGGMSVPAFAARSFVPPPSLNYNETPYIHALNRALQLEQTAVSLYAAKQRLSQGGGRQGASSATDRTSIHYAALRQLVRLIFAQRGLPSSDPSGLMAVTGTVAAKMSRFMPSVVQDPMLGVSAHRVELALARRYKKLLELAPETDRPMISALLRQVTEFTEQF